MLRRLVAPLALLALLLPACDSSAFEAQRLFETEALTSPIDGLNDAADWRIGPAYVGRYAILQRATPNPVSRTGTVALDLNVINGAGLQVTVLYEDPLTRRVEFLPLGTGSTCSADICAFSLSARQIDYTNAGGVYRLVVLDGDGIVTYGDVQVRG